MRNKLGIIGKPLGHSLSPKLHSIAIEKLSAVYTYESWELEENELKAFLDNVKSEESLIAGFNVTIPYKEKIIDFLDELDPLASTLKAVNTVKYENGRLKGYNTDGLGLLESLTKNNVDYEGKNILVIGAGGACKGIAMYLSTRNVNQIDIVARDFMKCELISSDIRLNNIQSKCISWNNMNKINLVEYQIIIQTTPIGMKNFIGVMEFPYEKLSKEHTVVDIVYNPLETTFLKKAKSSGANCINGLEMLVYQGYHSFKIWTGLSEDTDLMLSKGREMLEDKVE